MNPQVGLLRAFAFAAEKHKNHRRKDKNASPYINHLISVARFLVEEGGVTDDDLIVAAILHDTVEDTETTFAELEEYFGPSVAAIVREVTDDKTLKKAARKQLQEEQSSKASFQAKQLILADKICNVLDIMHNPPAGWSPERRREYIAWTMRVVAGCRRINESLDRVYDSVATDALRHLADPAAPPPDTTD